MMKCKLPNQDAGTSMIFIGDAMDDVYDPPGKEVREEDGVKYIEVQAEVGKTLTTEYGFEEMTEESTEDTTNDDSN